MSVIINGTTGISTDGGSDLFGTGTIGGSLTLTSGTANGVTYLNGSKVLTSGSALTFDGSNLGTSTSGSTGLTMTSSASQAFINLRSVATAGFEPFIGFGDVSAGNIAQMLGVSGGGVRWTVAGSEQMRLTSTGLGIGTSSPSQKLSIVGTSTFLGFGSGPQITMTDTSGRTLAFVAPGSVVDAYIGTTTNHMLNFMTGGTGKATLDSAGNLGLGVTPKASSWSSFENIGGVITAYNAETVPAVYLTANAYFNSGWKYKSSASNRAWLYSMDAYNGNVSWQIAPSGTAGNAISFTQAMTLDASGNLLVGTTSASGFRLQVDGGGGIDVSDTSQTSSRLVLGIGTLTAGRPFVGTNTNTNPLEIGTRASTDTIFVTNSTERLRIDSSGNVGIGTTSPNAKLFVAGAGDVVTINASASGQLLRMAQSSANPLIVRMVNNSGNFWDTQVNTDNSISWDYNDTERMRIDPSGNLLVYAQSKEARGVTLYGTGNNGFYVRTTGTCGYLITQDGVGGAGYFLTLYSNNTSVGSITTDGSSTAYNTGSDYRLKEDWQPMTGASERVKALKPVNFAWKADGSRVDGFLAHEAAEVVPEAVSGEKDAVDADGNPEYQGIDQSKLVPLLTAALQEALARIESLEADVATLKGAA